MVKPEAIRAVRAVVMRPIPEVKAALERTSGDVQAAIAATARPVRSWPPAIVRGSDTHDRDIWLH